MSEYRHEYKYLIHPGQEQILLNRAAGVMMRDSHTGPAGCYYIQSLYLDDRDNSCLKENEDGTDPRSKFRIRYYNHDYEHIRLEKKIKNRGMTKKESCSLTVEECRTIMDGRWVTVTSDMPPMKQKLLTEMMLRALQPRVIVAYERIPFVCAVGNVRITFDRALASSVDISHFLDGEYRCRPVLPGEATVLEVKWDELLPGYIRDVMSLERLQWTAFSKYYMCRKYNADGGLK